MNTAGLENILNFVPYSDSLVTSGQPKAEEFNLIRSAGFQVIINLATATSPNALINEADLVRQAGMQYIHIPVIWEQPLVEQFELFVRTLSSLQGSQVYLHCAMNFRASCFMFLYRVLYQGVDPETAWWDVKSVWEPDEVWTQFVRSVLLHFNVNDFSFMQ
jgi:protein tyrosine phosphatase (PTP) superfamily phosphohydrolase (DUF442 family)